MQPMPSEKAQMLDNGQFSTEKEVNDLFDNEYWFYYRRLHLSTYLRAIYELQLEQDTSG